MTGKAIMNRKLVKIKNNDYAYFVDGVSVQDGPLSLVKMVMESHGISDVELATEVMTENNDDVADFGINGNFIISQKFGNADMGIEVTFRS